MKKSKKQTLFLMLGALLFMGAISGCAQKQQQKKYDVAAYIWPAFHNDPRWKEIGLFKDGKGEWESIYKAIPKYDGHRQPREPLWGYLDEADPATQEKAIHTALEYGVNTFIFDWYWYDGRSFLEAPLNAFLKARGNQDMKFYLMWANHTANSYWDRDNPDKSQVYWRGEVDRQTFDDLTDHIIKDYLTKPNYYTIDGKPVFAIYELETFVSGMGGMNQAREALDAFRKKCLDAGLRGVHLQAILWKILSTSLDGVPASQSATQDNALRYLGFESVTTYQWCHYVPLQEYGAWGQEATSKYEEFSESFSVPYFAHVSVDWDNNPRFPDDMAQSAVSGVTPEKFKTFLKVARDYCDAHPSQVPLVTINAWNEWSEGSYLEPDTHYKYGFLEAVRDVFKTQE